MQPDEDIFKVGAMYGSREQLRLSQNASDRARDKA